MNTPQEEREAIVQDWEEDFDKKFGKYSLGENDGRERGWKSIEMLKPFIVRTLLSHEEKVVARVREEWHPIETAPKDGTHILVTSGQLCTVAHWFNDGFFLSWNEFEDNSHYQMDTITHWKAITLPITDEVCQ